VEFAEDEEGVIPEGLDGTPLAASRKSERQKIPENEHMWLAIIQRTETFSLFMLRRGIVCQRKMVRSRLISADASFAKQQKMTLGALLVLQVVLSSRVIGNALCHPPHLRTLNG
jgi:hypothetical protein